jgi:hypothetical protein
LRFGRDLFSPINFQVEDEMSPVRERYGEAFWRAHHEAWIESELNQREYCEAYGIPLKAFGNWRAKSEDSDYSKNTLQTVWRGFRIIRATVSVFSQVRCENNGENHRGYQRYWQGLERRQTQAADQDVKAAPGRSAGAVDGGLGDPSFCRCVIMMVRESRRLTTAAQESGD